MFNREQYLNKKYRLARPFLGPDVKEFLNNEKYGPENTFGSDKFGQMVDTHRYGGLGNALNHTKVGKFNVYYPNLNSDIDEDNITDEIRNILNIHEPIIKPNDTFDTSGVYYDRLSDLNNINRTSIRDLLGQKLQHHLYYNLSMPVFKLYNALRTQAGKDFNYYDIYPKFLNSYINHIDSLPNGQTKPDLLSYMANYKTDPREQLLLRLLGQSFNETYPSIHSKVYHDWHLEKHGEYAPRPQFKDLVERYLSTVNPSTVGNVYNRLQRHMPKDLEASPFINKHLFE